MGRRISETVQHAAFTPGAADAHGNPADAWGDPHDVGIYAFDPGSSDEVVVPGYDRVITAPAAFMPSTVIFGDRDHVTARGLLYEVDGETAQWRHPNGTRRGNVAKLKRVTG